MCASRCERAEVDANAGLGTPSIVERSGEGGPSPRQAEEDSWLWSRAPNVDNGSPRMPHRAHIAERSYLVALPRRPSVRAGSCSRLRRRLRVPSSRSGKVVHRWPWFMARCCGSSSGWLSYTRSDMSLLASDCRRWHRSPLTFELRSKKMRTWLNGRLSRYSASRPCRR